MNSPRFVHSFSTRPLLIDCYGIDGLRRLLAQVWYFSLSVAYLRRLGASVTLHTDTLGKAVLGHLPYDSVRLTLDDWPDWIHPRFWAAGKFLSIAAENGPCVHIDGDVFIKRPELLRRIGDTLASNDLIVQSSDPACMYAREVPFFETEKEFCIAHGIEADGRDSFNTGLLGFGSDRVRQELCGNYLDVVRYFSERYPAELDADSLLTPDLLAEQKMTEGFTRIRGWKVERLLSEAAEAARIGYQHVFTIDKMNCMPSCMETLRVVDPEIYAATNHLCGGRLPWLLVCGGADK